MGFPITGSNSPNMLSPLLPWSSPQTLFFAWSMLFLLPQPSFLSVFLVQFTPTCPWSQIRYSSRKLSLNLPAGLLCSFSGLPPSLMLSSIRTLIRQGCNYWYKSLFPSELWAPRNHGQYYSRLFISSPPLLPQFLLSLAGSYSFLKTQLGYPPLSEVFTD